MRERFSLTKKININFHFWSKKKNAISIIFTNETVHHFNNDDCVYSPRLSIVGTSSHFTKLY